MMSKAPNIADQCVNGYLRIQNDLYSDSIAQTQSTRSSQDGSEPSVTTLLSTYHCLQCATISTAETRAAHCEARKHMFCKFPNRDSTPLSEALQPWKAGWGVCIVIYVTITFTTQCWNHLG